MQLGTGWCSYQISDTIQRYISTYFPILHTYIHIHPIHDAMEMDYGTYSHDHGYVDFGDDHHYAGPRYVQEHCFTNVEEAE